MICPNKNTKQWKAMVKAFGEPKAYYHFMANDFDLLENDEIATVLNPVQLDKEDDEFKQRSYQLASWGIQLSLQNYNRDLEFIKKSLESVNILENELANVETSLRETQDLKERYKHQDTSDLDETILYWEKRKEEQTNKLLAFPKQKEEVSLRLEKFKEEYPDIFNHSSFDMFLQDPITFAPIIYGALYTDNEDLPFDKQTSSFNTPATEAVINTLARNLRDRLGIEFEIVSADEAREFLKTRGGQKDIDNSKYTKVLQALNIIRDKKVLDAIEAYDLSTIEDIVLDSPNYNYYIKGNEVYTWNNSNTTAPTIGTSVFEKVEISLKENETALEYLQSKHPNGYTYKKEELDEEKRRLQEYLQSQKERLVSHSGYLNHGGDTRFEKNEDGVWVQKYTEDKFSSINELVSSNEHLKALVSSDNTDNHDLAASIIYGQLYPDDVQFDKSDEVNYDINRYYFKKALDFFYNDSLYEYSVNDDTGSTYTSESQDVHNEEIKKSRIKTGELLLSILKEKDIDDLYYLPIQSYLIGLTDGKYVPSHSFDELVDLLPSLLSELDVTKLQEQIDDRPVRKKIDNISDELPFDKSKSNINGFYHNNKTYFVRENLNIKTTIHEFAHPFVDALYADNNKLFDSILKDLLKTTEGKAIESMVRSTYASDSTLMQDKEILVRAIAELGTKNIDPETGQAFLTAIKRFFEWLKSFFTRELSRKVLAKEKLTVQDLDMKTTIQEIADLITLYEGQINLRVKNKAGFVVEEVQQDVDEAKYHDLEKFLNYFRKNQTEIAKLEEMLSVINRLKYNERKWSYNQGEPEDGLYDTTNNIHFQSNKTTSNVEYLYNYIPIEDNKSFEEIKQSVIDDNRRRINTIKENEAKYKEVIENPNFDQFLEDPNTFATVLYGQLYPSDFKESKQSAKADIIVSILASNESSQEINTDSSKSIAFNIDDLTNNYAQTLQQIQSIVQPNQELSIQPLGTFTQSEQDLIDKLTLDINTNPNSNNNC